MIGYINDSGRIQVHDPLKPSEPLKPWELSELSYPVDLDLEDVSGKYTAKNLCIAIEIR